MVVCILSLGGIPKKVSSVSMGSYEERQRGVKHKR